MKVLQIALIAAACAWFGMMIMALCVAARDEKHLHAAKKNARELIGLSCMSAGRVMFIGTKLHADEPEHYPPAGTVGDIIKIHEDHQHALIRWPDGTTSEDGVWWVRTDAIVPAALIETEDE